MKETKRMSNVFLKGMADLAARNGYQISEIKEETVDVDNNSPPMITGVVVCRLYPVRDLEPEDPPPGYRWLGRFLQRLPPHG